MSKNLQKTLAGALATISAVSIATPVLGTNVDIPTLYQNAYDAMRKAENDKTQTSINEARKLIDQLLQIGKENNDEHLISDGSTWSSMVDAVQHPKLEKAVNAILKAQETKKQEDINEAYNSVEPELPDHWKLDYTGTIDIVQQELTNQATKSTEDAQAAYETVKNDKTEENLIKAQDALTKAKELVVSLTTSVNGDAKNWASNILTPKLDTIKLADIELYDLKVTNASFTKSGVTVTFDKLDKTLKNVTLTIEDNNGKTVKVETVNKILVGKTQAEFSFTNYLKERPTGIWTVNGVEFNLTEANFVTDVKEAKTKADLKKILSTEEYKGLVSYDEDNIQGYFNEINKDKDSLKTVSDVQKLIDRIDDSSSDKSDVKELKELAEEGTNTQFINGLASKNIERVNSDWVEAYRNLIKNTDKNTLKAIQELVDGENEERIVTEIKKNPIKNKEITALNELIDKYMNDNKVDGKKVTKKACMQDALEIQSTLVKIKNAGTVAKFKNNVETLKTLVSEFNSLKLNDVTYMTIDSVNNNLIESYIEEISKSDINTVAEFNELINETNTAKVKQAVDNVVAKLGVELDKNGKFTDAKKVEIKTAFEELVKATAHEENKENEPKKKFDISIVDMNVLEIYAEITANNVNELVDAINEANKTLEDETIDSVKSKLIAALNGDSKEEALKALQDKTLNLSSVKAENIDDYILEKDSIISKLNEQKESLKQTNEFIDIINKKVNVVNAKTNSEMLTALRAYSEARTFGDFNNLAPAKKADVAQELLNVLSSDVVYGIGALENEITTKAIPEVKTKLKNLEEALSALHAERESGIAIITEDKTVALSEALEAITQETIDGILLDKFYTNSLVTGEDGSITLKSYNNYADVRAALK